MIIELIEKDVIQFQGDHTDFMFNYLVNQGIDEKNIYIKGL